MTDSTAGLSASSLSRPWVFLSQLCCGTRCIPVGILSKPPRFSAQASPFWQRSSPHSPQDLPPPRKDLNLSLIFEGMNKKSAKSGDLRCRKHELLGKH